MQAMVMTRVGEPLRLLEVDSPTPGPLDLLLRVRACAVCRTDLHIVDGDLPEPRMPLIPGHEIIAEVVARGDRVQTLEVGQRVGVPWLGSTCGSCPQCRAGRENLCDRARFTGYDIHGGFAEYAVADHRYAFPIPAAYDDLHAAPLLCAGLIGYRALRMAEDAGRLGLYGFGAAAHIIAQVAVHQGREVYAFTRPGDASAQAFARRLGATWAGASGATPPRELDAAILFAPVGSLVPEALRVVRKGGIVVCAGIHMSPIPEFAYSRLWGERVIRSVANLTRRDGEEFFTVAPRVPVRTEVESFPLHAANQALERLRDGRIDGAAVLRIAQE